MNTPPSTVAVLPNIPDIEDFSNHNSDNGPNPNKVDFSRSIEAKWMQKNLPYLVQIQIK